MLASEPLPESDIVHFATDNTYAGEYYEVGTAYIQISKMAAERIQNIFTAYREC